MTGSEKICAAADCTNAAGLHCPTCEKLKALDDAKSHFCAQECMQKSWDDHKKYHNEVKSKAKFDAAMAAAQAGNNTEALKFISAAIKHAPDQPGLYYGRAQFFEEHDMFERALEDATEALRLHLHLLETAEETADADDQVEEDEEEEDDDEDFENTREIASLRFLRARLIVQILSSTKQKQKSDEAIRDAESECRWVIAEMTSDAASRDETGDADHLASQSEFLLGELAFFRADFDAAETHWTTTMKQPNEFVTVSVIAEKLNQVYVLSQKWDKVTETCKLGLSDKQITAKTQDTLEATAAAAKKLKVLKRSDSDKYENQLKRYFGEMMDLKTTANKENL